jgi:hypothetical protein
MPPISPAAADAPWCAQRELLCLPDFSAASPGSAWLVIPDNRLPMASTDTKTSFLVFSMAKGIKFSVRQRETPAIYTLDQTNASRTEHLC